MTDAATQARWRDVLGRHGLVLEVAHDLLGVGPAYSLVPRYDMEVRLSAVTGGHTVLARQIPSGYADAWVPALLDVLDVPAGRLLPPDSWERMADELVRFRAELAGLPTGEGSSDG